jgi:hypothetical protein
MIVTMLGSGWNARVIIAYGFVLLQIITIAADFLVVSEDLLKGSRHHQCFVRRHSQLALSIAV